MGTRKKSKSRKKSAPKKKATTTRRKQTRRLTDKKLDLSDVLIEVNQRWLANLDLERLLPEIGQLTMKLLRADDVSLLLVDPNGKELVEHMMVSHRRAPDNRYRIRIKAEGITGYVASQRKPLIVKDVRKDSRYVTTSDNIRSEAAVPVLAGDRLLGVLNVESTEVGHFGRDQAKILKLLASQIAIALLNVEAHDREAGRGRQLMVLHHLSRVGDGAIPPEAFVQRVVNAVRREFACYYTAAFLGDHESEQVLLLDHSCAEEIEVTRGQAQPFGSGLIGTAFKIGETLNVRDVTQDPIYVAKVPGIRSEVCVPIRVGDHCLGILDAQSKQIDAFTPDDVVFLETVSRFLVPTLQVLAGARAVSGD